MLMQILEQTPKWVFVVFFVLLFYGYIQSRTREAGIVRVTMLPVIMTVLSIGGVMSSFGGKPVSLAAWAVGFVAAILLNRIIRSPAGVSYNPATKRFHLPGSWTPLVLMMAIYFAKYTVGATTGLRPDIAATTEFATIVSFLFGGFSGAFFARFLRIWSTSRQGIGAPTLNKDRPNEAEPATIRSL